jgi:hypothetical protein
MAKITNHTNCWVCPEDLWAPKDIMFQAFPLAMETLLYNVTHLSLPVEVVEPAPPLMSGWASFLLGYYALCFERVGARGLLLSAFNSSFCNATFKINHINSWEGNSTLQSYNRIQWPCSTSPSGTQLITVPPSSISSFTVGSVPLITQLPFAPVLSSNPT